MNGYKFDSELTEAEAKTRLGQGKRVWMAWSDGETWNAGQMVAIGGLLGLFSTKAAAKAACREYLLDNPDLRDKVTTDTEEIDMDFPWTED